MVRRWHADPFGFLRPWNEVPALIGSAPPSTPPSTGTGVVTFLMKRMGTPADVGSAVALLCAEEASFITGQILYVDGGASVMFSELPLPIQGL